MYAWPMNEAFIDYVRGKPDSGIINDERILISVDEIISRDQVTDEADVTAGWHAIEFLLWGLDFSSTGAGARTYKDYVKENTASKRRGIYLTAVTQLLVNDL